MEVALSLSGGGFRAAMFHLGVLSYLNKLKLADGRCFLDVVNTISTISGGTITGLWYMMNFCKGRNTDETLHELYKLLTTIDFPKDTWNSFTAKENSNTSFIKEAIKFYDANLFHGETFGSIMKEADEGHIHHFSANGIDFTNGIAFRFQASKKIQSQPKFSYGLIGNKKHQIEREDAAQIKLSEILAVSSCFPGGFESLIFPTDFAFYNSGKTNRDKYKDVSIPLMDGGIADNQGIEPLLLASDQMTYDNVEAKDGDSSYPSHDLIIVSDVSSAASKVLPNINIWNPFNRIKNLSISKCKNVTLVLTIMMLALSVISFCFEWQIALGAFAMMALMCLIGYCLFKRTLSWIGKNLSDTGLDCDWEKIKYVRFEKLWDVLSTRASSLIHLSSFVFMKPIRRLRYNQLYKDNKWNNRLISSIISELSSEGSWRWKIDGGKIPKYMKPSDFIINNSDNANSMGTTLWFTEKDKKEGIPESLLSCGQCTICWNLLEYIEKLKVNNDNTNGTHKLIMQCEQQLREDWDKFQKNPLFLIKKQKI